MNVHGALPTKLTERLCLRTNADPEVQKNVTSEALGIHEDKAISVALKIREGKAINVALEIREDKAISVALEIREGKAISVDKAIEPSRQIVIMANKKMALS
jgi:hypothetical protein